MKVLLELRNKLKKKKPEFVRQDAHKIKRLKKKWRKPKGLHSKMRHGFRGYRRCVQVGWGSPAKVKGLHKSGMKMRVVHSIKDMIGIDNAKEGIIISRKLGLRKKLQVIDIAIKNKITVFNLKDPVKFIEETRKQKEDSKKKKKEEVKKKESKKVKQTKKTIEEKVETEEEKAKREKKEKDKLLTKRS